MAEARTIIANWLVDGDGSADEELKLAADSLLAALSAKGLKVLGREPDEAMEAAGLKNARTWWPPGALRTEREHLFLWSAMWDAAE